jgi:glycogen debranching enzyme
MDKMGSSERAGNCGNPATPRNGSAVELVGLCYATAKWLGDLFGRGKYPFSGVEAEKELPGSCLAFY